MIILFNESPLEMLKTPNLTKSDISSYGLDLEMEI